MLLRMRGIVLFTGLQRHQISIHLFFYYSVRMNESMFYFNERWSDVMGIQMMLWISFTSPQGRSFTCLSITLATLKWKQQLTTVRPCGNTSHTTLQECKQSLDCTMCRLHAIHCLHSDTLLWESEVSPTEPIGWQPFY